MGLYVYCECDQPHPVGGSDFGSSLTCSCGRRVIVPLFEEFRTRPMLLSAATLERRIIRLIKHGELPGTSSCARCGAVDEVETVNVAVICETSTTHVSGGPRLLFLPGLWVRWNEPRRVEVHGRDNVLAVPMPLCPECQERLWPSARWRYLLAAGILVVAAAAVAYFQPCLGFTVLAVGLVLLYGVILVARGRRQRALKELLRQVPVYRQLLEKYPHATVALAASGPASPE